MKNKNFIAVLLVIVIVVIASLFIFKKSYAPPSPAQLINDNNSNIVQSADEEYGVYSALINSLYMNEQRKIIVIKVRTEDQIDSLLKEQDREISYLAIKKNIPELDQQTLDNFKTVNQESVLLKRQFNLPVNYVLLSPEEVKNIRWNDFYNQYPGAQGVMELSRVGFNRNKTQALVYVGNSSYPLAGEGLYVFLIRVNNIWTIQKEMQYWIS